VNEGLVSLSVIARGQWVERYRNHILMPRWLELMLLAVEGGGFFSSSASGYSKGLTLLLLGQKHEDKPMRVTPWNQYQLVDQEPDSDLQLASLKNRLSHGCASFICFGRASAHESPSPLKVGPAQQQDVLPDPLVADREKDLTTELEVDNYARKITLKSNLKKASKRIPVPVEDVKQSEPLNGQGSDIPGHTERRKVQWTDVCGSELAEIREFEPRYGSTLSWSKLWALHLFNSCFKHIEEILTPPLESL